MSNLRNQMLDFFLIKFHQARLDDEVEDLATQIEAKYPMGLCTMHPDIRCFHHHVADLHFDIGNRSRRLVWAAAIVSSCIFLFIRSFILFI